MTSPRSHRWEFFLYLSLFCTIQQVCFLTQVWYPPSPPSLPPASSASQDRPPSTPKPWLHSWTIPPPPSEEEPSASLSLSSRGCRPRRSLWRCNLGKHRDISGIILNVFSMSTARPCCGAALGLFKGSGCDDSRGKCCIVEVIIGSTRLTPFRAGLLLFKLDDNTHTMKWCIPPCSRPVFTMEGNSRRRSAQ